MLAKDLEVVTTKQREEADDAPLFEEPPKTESKPKPAAKPKAEAKPVKEEIAEADDSDDELDAELDDILGSLDNLD